MRVDGTSASVAVVIAAFSNQGATVPLIGCVGAMKARAATSLMEGCLDAELYCGPL
jgi:hypothetical protein